MVVGVVAAAAGALYLAVVGVDVLLLALAGVLLALLLRGGCGLGGARDAWAAARRSAWSS